MPSCVLCARARGHCDGHRPGLLPLPMALCQSGSVLIHSVMEMENLGLHCDSGQFSLPQITVCLVLIQKLPAVCSAGQLQSPLL